MEYTENIICPACKAELKDFDLEECPVCGNPIDVKDFGRDRKYPWVKVWTTNTMIDAEMFRANLESADIPVQLMPQVDSTRQFTIGGLAIVKIYVPSPMAIDALDIIKAIESQDD